MTQLQKVIAALQQGYQSIKDIYEHTGILRPNIRRILGQGAIKGTFRRLDTGVYELVTETGERRAYIECAKAEEALPRLEAQGVKFDMVFLDPAYYSINLVKHNNGNRGIDDYGFIHTGQFADCLQHVYRMMKTDDSHVYLMLSGAKSTQHDMQKYLFAALESGLQYVDEGHYLKMFSNGKRFTNVRGLPAAPERLVLLTRSGKVRAGELPRVKDITAVRPSIKISYATQKAEAFCDQVILQSTQEHDTVLDLFSGSGIMAERSLLWNRIIYAIDCIKETVDNFITPKIKSFAR